VFGQNHLFVKMLSYKGFRYSEEFQKILSTSLKISGSLSVVRTIEPSRPDSIRLDDVPYLMDASQTKNHSSEQRTFSVWTSTISRSYCSSLYPSGRISSPSGRLPVIDQLQILSEFKIRED